MPETLLPVSADYTDKDFDSIRRRLFAVIQSVFPTWTDYSVANFGNILVEMFSWCLDVTAFYQDNQALESRITTASQRKNLLALVKLINYEPASARAAQARVLFTADPPPDDGDDIVLGEGSNPFPIVVKTSDADVVEYELQHTLTLTNAEPSAWGLVENSKTHTETFTASGLPNQEIVLSEAPYLDGTAFVVADNGGYSEVDHFLNSIATDRHYTVVANNLDVATIRFGNQVSGQLPSGTIIVQYKTGGGSRANVEPEAINKIDGAYQTVGGQPATITVLNGSGERAAGGFDRESEAQIKEKAPQSVRVLSRAVAREDFELLARTPLGMARALMLTSIEDDDVPLNQGKFYIIPSSGYAQIPGFPTTAQMEEVYRTIRSRFPWPATFDVQMQMPTFIDISIRARVFRRKGYSLTQTRAAVEAALLAYFSLVKADLTTNTEIDFGFYYQTNAVDGAKVVPLSDIMNAVRDCAAVQRLGTALEDFTIGAVANRNTGSTTVRLGYGSHLDIPIRAHEFPRLATLPGSLVLVDGPTSTEF